MGVSGGEGEGEGEGEGKGGMPRHNAGHAMHDTTHGTARHATHDTAHGTARHEAHHTATHGRTRTRARTRARRMDPTQPNSRFLLTDTSPALASPAFASLGR